MNNDKIEASELPPKQQENALFTEWWNRNQACPEHSLITENAAHAAWQARAAIAMHQPAATSEILAALQPFAKLCPDGVPALATTESLVKHVNLRDVLRAQQAIAMHRAAAAKTVNVKAIHSAVLALRVDPAVSMDAKVGFQSGVHRAAAVVASFNEAAAEPVPTDLPTNDEVYAEVCRERGKSAFYVSSNAVNDVMAAVRRITATKPAASEAVGVPGEWREVCQEVLTVMDKAKKLLKAVGFTMEGGGVSGPYNVAADKLRSILAAPAAPTGAEPDGSLIDEGTKTDAGVRDKLYAERYRWLRRQPYQTWKRIAWNTMNDDPYVFDVRDKEIDAAMAKPSPQAPKTEGDGE